jgi:tetratricopeptide (TPR) repeat protein
MGKDCTRALNLGSLAALLTLFCAVVSPQAPVVLAQTEPAVPSAEAGEDLLPPGEAPLEPEPPTGPDLTQANELIRAQEWAEADEVLSTVLTEWPDDVAALLLRGEVLLAMQRPDEAKPLLERVVELDPERPRGHFQLATALQATGDTAGALSHFGLEIERNDSDEVRIWAHTNRSIIFEQERKWAEAAAEMEAVVAIDPDEPRFYGDLASLYLQAEELDKVAEALERGVEAGFSSPQHYYILGSRYYRKDDFEQAAQAFEQALELNPNSAAVEKSLGATFERMERNADAASHFQRYLELAPDAPDAKEIEKHIDKLRKG